MGEVGFTSRQEAIQGFLELMKDIKEVELHLTMGESIVHAVLGPLSPVARDGWTTGEADFVPGCPTGVADKELNWIIDQLTKEYMISTNPNIKQASVVFLLAVLQHGQKHPVGVFAELSII